MELTLFYRGRLPSNGGSREKHDLRRKFHEQLGEFWKQNPLADYRFLWEGDASYFRKDIDISRRCGSYTLVPLVNERLHLVVDLNVQLLRPEPPGSVKSQSGDLDNRMKTLMDALRIPSSPSEVPADEAPTADEVPLFCLLEDDALINSITVTTHRWLDPSVNHKEAILVINVRTSVTRLTALNAELAGNVI